MSLLIARNLKVSRGERVLLESASLEIVPGECVALTGANGAGKSSLLAALMGDESVTCTGEVSYEGADLLALKMDERARRGIFLAHQDAPTFPGLTVMTLLEAALKAKDATLTIPQIFERIRAAASRLDLSEDFLKRDANVGFSGGEKKRLEMLSLLTLSPRLALIDEIDSGLDQHMKARVADVLKEEIARGCGMLIVSHDPHFFDVLPVSRQLNIDGGQLA